MESMHKRGLLFGLIVLVVIVLLDKPISVKQIGIVASVANRLKNLYFVLNGDNDRSSSSCQNNGVCRDGSRCFSASDDSDHQSGYYNPSYGQKCPCHNGGVCQAKPNGFECICPPGYSGDLCKTTPEERISNLERRIDDLTKNLQAKLGDLQSRPAGSWQLHRENEVLNQLDKIELHQQTPTYTQRMPIVLPSNTRAILISIFCNFRNNDGHAYLNYVTHQKGNDNAAAKAEGTNTHFNVYANTFLYEQMIPWNTALPNELIFTVTSSYLTGGNKNWYRVRLVGYITSP